MATSLLLVYAVILLIAGFVFILLELLLPSGGLLSVLAAGSLIGSLLFAFKINSITGWSFVALNFFLVPTLVIGGLRLIPKTRFGKRLYLIKTPQQQRAGLEANPHIEYEDYTVLLGKQAITVTPLRPSGTVEIDNNRYSVTAKGQLIDQNTPVVVTRIEGNNIIVEKLEK